MSLATAFKTAWQDAKAALTKADTFLTKETPAIQSDVKEVSSVATAVDPSLAPVVTAFDSIEESLFSEIAAAVHDGSALTTSTGATTVTLSAGLSGVVKSIVSTISGAPAVVAAAK